MSAQKLDTDLLRSRLKLRSFASEKALTSNHPVASDFFTRLQLRPGQIRQKAAKLLTSGVLAGSVLLSAHVAPIARAADLPKNESLSFAVSQIDLANQLRAALPPIGQWQLTVSQEKEVSDEIWQTFGVHTNAQLEGNRLNNSYGRMGAEQHLPRYPGDTIGEHGQLLEKGITPGLGGWGYFALSKAQMTPELYDTEKYYVAVQTLYLPDWNTRTRELVKWYKYRRVVVVNPSNGRAVVAAVADAGPANWTGKHFGGSPEVMDYLRVNYAMQNHPVVLFFLDDPNHEVPLGPLENKYNRKTV